MRLTGRRIVGGRSEGEVVASERPLSFLGGVDPATGVVREEHHPLQGESVAGRVLAFPQAKGSTVGSYVLFALARRRLAPAAIVATRAETILAVGAVLAELPTIDRIPVDLLRTGDRAIVRAEEGVVEVPGVAERSVVTAFLERDGRILVVRRGDRVGTFPGRWSGISGSLQSGEDVEAGARREVEEETGLRDLTLVGRGPVLRARNEDVVFAIHPIRFEAPRGEVQLDWENVEARWIRPDELGALETVPKLVEAYRATTPP